MQGKQKNSSLNFSDVCFVGPVPPSFPSCFSLVKIFLDLLDLPNWGWSGPFFSPVPSVSGFFLAWWVIGTSPVPGVCGTPFKLTLLFMPYKYGDDPNYLHQALSLSEKAIWFEPFFISRFKERWLKKPWNRAIVVGNHLLGGGFRVPTSRPHHLVCFYS